MSGPQLYTHYCAACHGEDGDGQGPAARFLYPKPRDFRAGVFRMVTSANRVASDADLMRVLERGMPGSAMFPMGHLSEAERRELVARVRELARKGIEDQERRDAKQVGQEVEPAELARTLERRTRPQPAIAVPGDLAASDSAAAARGHTLYLKQCASCHGETGKGDGVQEQKDSTGMPIRPRDFTRGIFKGGREREQLYARIVLGVPDTPMPAYPSLTPAEIGDLVNYILSLSDATVSAAVEHRRTRVTARRAGGTLPEEIPDSMWEAIVPTRIVVSPLWWRDFPEPGLRVQAIHDGQTLAIRLSWQDGTRNAQAVRPQDFPDMAAVQLFKGEREPFLGMGATDGSVDVWLWNAAAQADRNQYNDVDMTYPNMVVDLYPFEGPGDGPLAHATARQPKEFLTAWAAGNLRSDPTHPADATSLQAKGFGSTTMRPRTSQVVRAAGEYKDGHWSVVLRRPLQIAPDAGLSITPGDSLSMAFALWEGSVHDRNGQKLVSIWHDLIVE